MRISRKQFNTFNRINEQLKTSSKFFITNFRYLMRKYFYLRKPHYIVKCRLKFKKEKVIILFNQLKKWGPKYKSQKGTKKVSSKKSHKKSPKKICPGKAHLGSSTKKTTHKSEKRVIKKVTETNDGETVSKMCKKSATKGADSVSVAEEKQLAVNDETPIKDRLDVTSVQPKEKIEDNNLPLNKSLIEACDKNSSKNRQSDGVKDVSATCNNA